EGEMWGGGGAGGWGGPGGGGGRPPPQSRLWGRSAGRRHRAVGRSRIILICGRKVVPSWERRSVCLCGCSGGCSSHEADSFKNQPAPLEHDSVPSESERALDSLFGAYSYRRTGGHFAGICARASRTSHPRSRRRETSFRSLSSSAA